MNLAGRPEQLKDPWFTYRTYSVTLEALFSDAEIVAGRFGRRAVTKSFSSSDTRGVVYIRRIT